MEIIKTDSEKPKGYKLVVNPDNNQEKIVEHNGIPKICPFKTILPMQMRNALTNNVEMRLKVFPCVNSCMHFQEMNKDFVILTCGSGFEFEVK